MLKVLGSLMLLCGCTGIGLLQIKHMDKRIGTLQSMVWALEVMEQELSFRVPSLEEMFAAAVQLTEGPTKMFFSSCKNELNKGLNKPFCEIWSQTAQEQLSALKKSDIDPILALGSVLGRYDSEGQLQAIVRTQKALEQECSNAVIERSNKGKVYRVVSTTVGVFLLILLL